MAYASLNGEGRLNNGLPSLSRAHELKILGLWTKEDGEVIYAVKEKATAVCEVWRRVKTTSKKGGKVYNTGLFEDRLREVHRLRIQVRYNGADPRYV